MWEVWLWAALCSGLVLSAPHLGESTELAWLLVHESPQQSPLMLRRITPKSVFLAPTFTSCSEGYRQDSMGRCVKVVKLNQQAQWDFFLQKLNSMYAEPPKKDASTSLRFPIPIDEDPASTTTTTADPTTAATTEEPTETQFLIVVANTTMPMETTAETTTTEGATTSTQVTEETVPVSTMRTTLAMESTTTTTGGSTGVETSTLPTSMKCEDCEEAGETVVTESYAPPKNTVRFPEFPDPRKRPSSSSYVRFPESYPSSVVSSYWWPHSWDRSQVVWQPPHHNSRPSSYRPHWSTPF